MANYKDKFCFVIGGEYEEYNCVDETRYLTEHVIFWLSHVELYNIGTN